MKKSLDISIIIPVYNAEKYLMRCLDSVLEALGKTPGEILIIDNGSSDNSLKIAKEVQKSHSKTVTVLQCHTPGAAAVRNFGAKRARGEYIWFVDADDTIAKNAISVLLDKARAKRADFVMIGARRIYQDGHSDYLPAVSDGDKSRFVRYGLGPWQVLIRHKWWQEYNFQFKEGIIHEDMELMSALILCTNNFSSVDAPLYNYYQTNDSVLHKNEFDAHIFDIFPALTGLYERFVYKNAEHVFHAELEWFFIWNLLIDSAKDFARFPEGRPGFERTREILKTYFPKWRRNKFLRQKPLRLQARVRINYRKR